MVPKGKFRELEIDWSVGKILPINSVALIYDVITSSRFREKITNVTPL